MRQLIIMCSVSALVFNVLLRMPTMVSAQEGAGVSLEATSGRETTGVLQYRAHCASCHGPTGKGDGPVAAALTIKPTDLTMLAKNNHGEFPEKRVAAFIDGSEMATAHGTREMPIWGFVFSQPKAAAGTPAGLGPQEIKQRIQLLVDYIKSIQER